MGYTNAKQLKKGMEVFRYGAWNFHPHSARQLMRGYTEIPEDKLYIDRWFVHSVGKSVLRLIDENGEMAKFVDRSRCVDNGTNIVFFGISLSKEMAEQCAIEMWESDINRTKTYSFIYNTHIDQSWYTNKK